MGSSVVLTDDDDNALKRRIMHHSCFYLNSPLYCLMSLGSNIERDSVCKEQARGVHIRVVEQLSKNENQMEKASRQKYNVPVCPSVCNSRTN